MPGEDSLNSVEALPEQSDDELRDEVGVVNRLANQNSDLRDHLDHRCGNSSPKFNRERFNREYAQHIGSFMCLRNEAAAINVAG